MKWKIKKRNVQRSEWNCEENFFPTNVCFPMWSIKWRGKQINVCFTLTLWRLTSYFLILKTSMPWFGCLSFWAPTCFPKVIRPSYGPGSLQSPTCNSPKPWCTSMPSHTNLQPDGEFEYLSWPTDNYMIFINCFIKLPYDNFLLNIAFFQRNPLLNYKKKVRNQEL